MTDRRLAVVAAGMSQPSSTRLLADRLADAARSALEHRGLEVGVDVMELRDHARDLTDSVLTGFPPPRLRDVIKTVTVAEGLVAVTPIYTGSYSGLFKTFFDVLEVGSLADKPVLIAATGGTERHSLALEHALRPLFTYLRAVVVPTSVYAASSDWGSGDAGSGGRGLRERIDRAADQLAQLLAASSSVGPTDPFEDLTPFAQLLSARSRTLAPRVSGRGAGAEGSQGTVLGF